ncbi:MAG: DUF3987 domain-containing protein, partial [Planctomycetota bacterium]
GRVLLNCRSGNCSAQAIVERLELQLRDLFPAGSVLAPVTSQSNQPRSASYPDPGALGEKFARQVGGKPASYDYFDAAGELVGRVYRFDLEGGVKHFRQGHCENGRWYAEAMPHPRPPYRLPELLRGAAAVPVFVVEGEKCADAVAELGFVATTSSQGAQSPHKTDWSHLEGRKVVIMPDQDEPGSRYAEKVLWLARQAGADAVVVLHLDGLDESGDVVDWIRMRRDAGADLEAIATELQQLAKQALAATPVDSSPPEEVDGYTEFPLHALPAECRQMAEEGSTAHSVDPAFFAVPMLPILAGCIGNSCRVLVKEGWSEPSVMWAAIVAHSGAGKSPPLRQLLQAIEEHESVLERRHAQAVKDYEQLLAAQAKDKKEPLPPRPLWKGLLVQDATWEALATRLEAHPRGLLMYQDELAGFFKSFNKYRGGDDREKWLSHFDAGTVRVDRKGMQGRGPVQIRIPYGAVSVVGTVQPRIALECMQGSSEESGLAARFRLAMPPSRPAVWSEMTISAAARAGWKAVVEGLLRLSFDPDRGPKIIPLGPEARAMFIAYHDLNGQAAHEAGDSGAEGLASELSKLRGFAARLALVLELARAAATGNADAVEVIGEEAMRSSLEITRWFEAEAKRFRRFAASRSRGAPNRLEDRLCKLLVGGPQSVTQLSDGLGRNYPAQDIRSALVALQQKGRARCLGTRPSGTAGGRPVGLWQLAS